MLFGFDTKKKKILTMLTLIMLVGTAFFTGTVLALAPTTWADQPTYIGPGSMVSDASYIIFKDASGGYCAKNGTSGRVDYRSSDMTDVMNSALLSSGNIYLSSGSYNFDGQLNVLSGTHIIGSKDSVITASGLTGTLFMCTGNNISISSLTFSIAEINLNPITIENATDTTITNCVIEGGFKGIYVLSSENTIIIGNVFVNCDDAGVYVEGSKNTVVDSNTVTNCGNGIVKGFRFGIIVRNGIFGDTEFTTISNNIITINRISYNVTGGILLSGENYVTWGVFGFSKVNQVSVTGNIVTGFDDDTSSVGIYTHYKGNLNVVNVTISENIVTGFCGGIEVSGQKFSITGNVVNSCSVGIWGFGLNNSVISGNILDNQYTSVYYPTHITYWAGTTAGISLAGSSYSIVTSNNINYFPEGISGWRSMYSFVEYCYVAENMITNCPVPINNTHNTSLFENNQGVIMENRGTATLTTGLTSLIVAHGMGYTPTFVILTGLTTYTSACWVTAVNATSFTIKVATPVSGNCGVYWYAVYAPYRMD